jgi:hypothetical protein
MLQLAVDKKSEYTKGEELVIDHLIKEGYTVYSPSSSYHNFDLVVAGKGWIYLADVKTGQSRKFYPDFGIKYSSFQNYDMLSKKHNLPFFIYFVDVERNVIFGNWLSELSKNIDISWIGRKLHYPIVDNNRIYFPLVNVNLIKELWH